MAKIASRTVEVPGRTLSIEEATALVEKAQNLAGHFPTEEDMEAGRRILTGEITEEQAIAQLHRKVQGWMSPEPDKYTYPSH